MKNLKFCIAAIATLFLVFQGQLPAQSPIPVEEFLEHPLDLPAFKIAKRTANSGVYHKRDYLHRPGYEGFYYYYFLFGGRHVNGPHIVVYKEGNDPGDYYDTNEEWIEIQSSREDPALKKANLVGKSRSEITNWLGAPRFAEGRLIHYVHEKVLLSVAFVGDQVKWFRISRLNFSPKTASEIPAELKSERIH